MSFIARSSFAYRILELRKDAGLRRYFRPKYQLRQLVTGRGANSSASQAESGPNDPSTTSKISQALQEASGRDGSLLAPVHIPEDTHAILKERHPATSILANSTLVVTRDMEMMNVMLGYEEANKYAILDAQGNHIGYMAEQEFGLGRMMTRQLLRTHRAFTTHVFDKHLKEVLRFYRPFSYINSNIGVYDPLNASTNSQTTHGDVQTRESSLSSTSSGQATLETASLGLAEMRLIGEARQEWAPLRRKYNLYFSRPSEPEASDLTMSTTMEQFARVDAAFLSWDFPLRDQSGDMIGSVSRNWTNFGRELFTDAGCYALRMDSAVSEADATQAVVLQDSSLGHRRSLTLDQRAVMLATAVTIDYDYFSRERSGFFGGMPLWMVGSGGEAAGAAEAGEVAAASASTEVARAAAAGGVARGAASGVSGAGEGAMAGAGTLGAYEAMQRARESSQVDDASLVEDQNPSQTSADDFYPQQSLEQDQWSEPQSPQPGRDNGWGLGGQDSQESESSGVTDWLSDLFDDE